MAPANKNPNITKRQTGTVPKATSSYASYASSMPKSTSAGKSSASSQKNTEIVAPTRRELNDLNDYLLSVAESAKQSNNVDHTHLESTCFELENLNFQENQRFCWPVRPIPRRNIFNKERSADTQQLGVPFNAATTGCIHPSSYQLNSNSSGNIPQGQGSAAIGVVIPTTPNSITVDDSFTLNRGGNSSIISGHNQPQASLEDTIGNQLICNNDSDLTWEQRLNFIQYFLSLTSKSLNKYPRIEFYSNILNIVDNWEDQIVSLVLKNFATNMVNEYKDGIYMNSTSLEDVAHTEANDTRAQSITSIQSPSVPNTPTYEELHTKLEASNRNIQNIKDQQQQLLRLQQSAKQHLKEMENIRNQHTQPPHFTQNGSGPPVYESVEEVHNDMSNLVSRMKNLTNFIQGQHELSAMLGEDGPEIIAEQEALQKKLEELQSQKHEMRDLVSELQDLSSAAENSLKHQQQQEEMAPRVVPIEYERVVPIELIGASKPQDQNITQNGHYQHMNGQCNGSIDSDLSGDVATNGHADEESEAVAETSELIRQKMSDINSMKNQLKRLKDMMETVKLIENKAEGKSIKEIAEEAENLILNSTLPHEVISPKAVNRNPTPLAAPNRKSEPRTAQEEEMSEKVRMLHEMTQDLRDQAVTLAAERDRLKIIKDEMTRRRDVGDESVGQDKILNREASPQRSFTQMHTSKDTEKHIIKAEYEAKKKEFEKLCERLQTEEELSQDIDGHQEEEIKRNASNSAYYSENWRQHQNMSSNLPLHCGKDSMTPLTPIRGKDSTDSGAADIHGVASLEAGSMQSGSSRSFSMPPPMRTLNTRENAWRKNSHDNSQNQFEQYAPLPPPIPGWNPGYYYSMPYSQQFNPNCHHIMIAPNNGAGDYLCPHQLHTSSVTATNQTSSQSATIQQSGLTSNDPVLLQQFIQTQQMLINSVSQCNQLLWHQQREINNLNNAVLLLQERIINSSAVAADMVTANVSTNRAESVPPTGIAVSNNVYTTSHRAQSEQPHQPFQTIQHPLSSPVRHQYQAYNSFQQNRRNFSNTHQSQHLVSNAAYNYSSATEQGSVLCSQIPPLHGQQYASMPNNPSQSQPTNFLNNDVPHPSNIQPQQQHPAPPIFMHHHNNTITPSDISLGANVQQPHHTNNNSNLLTSQQNSLNSPSANASQNTTTNNIPSGRSSNSAAAAAALNNQVAPGNRANNYWDNFRSYSRQNLLSGGSCKSNEEQQQFSTSVFAGNTVNGVSNEVRNLQQLNENSATNSSNLIPLTSDNKYFHTFRNHFNTNMVSHQQQLETVLGQGPASRVVHSLTASSNMERLDADQINQSQNQNSMLLNQITQPGNNINNEVFSFNNSNSNNAAVLSSPDFRNMNFNFAANELRKKEPFKTSCNTKRLRQSQPIPNAAVNYSYQTISSNETRPHAINQDTFLEPEISQQLGQPNEEDDDINGKLTTSLYEEASAEIKKNLLVNALKSDKFTSKFFESLKEDVYREVYELQLISTSDPLRNIVMQAMHDLYKRSCTEKVDSSDNFTNDSSDMNGTSSLLHSVNNENLQSSRPLSDNHTESENNYNNQIMNSLLNSQELKRLAYKIMLETTSTAEKDRKVGSKYDLSSPSADTTRLPNEIYRPDHDLINHVMVNIRNSVRSHKIDDDIMIRIAKLTCSILEQFSASTSRYSHIGRIRISPKELYRKMKSFEVRDRENFLGHYENYLQTVIVMKIVNEDTNNVNLANKRHDGNLFSNSHTLNTNEVQNLRRNMQANKSNIDIPISRKIDREEEELERSAANEVLTCPDMPIVIGRIIPQMLNENCSRSSSNLISTIDINLDGHSHNPVSSSNTNHNNNNMMNEDLAEADQVCTSTNNDEILEKEERSDVRCVSFSEYKTKAPKLTEEFLMGSGHDEIGENEKEDCARAITPGYHNFVRDIQQPVHVTCNRQVEGDPFDNYATAGARQCNISTEAILNDDNGDGISATRAAINDSACSLVCTTSNNMNCNGGDISESKQRNSVP